VSHTGRGPLRGPDPVLRAAAAHVFVEDLDSDPLVVGTDDEHHLYRVLRLRPGQAVTACDGNGRWRPCRLGAGSLLPDGEVVEQARPRPAITVAFSLAKGDRTDWAVQKLTELGVDRMVPLLAERTVVVWDHSKADRHRQRWTRISREAAAQARLVRLPVVEAPTPVPDLLSRLGPSACAAEPGGEMPGLDHPAVLVGPEGGWGPDELPEGLHRVGAGPTVLRTETAAVALGAALSLARALG